MAGILKPAGVLNMARIDKSKVWTGTLNELALAGRTPPKPRFYDTTLRDGEQSVGVMFDPEQKLEIARLLDGLGVGRIEAGFPRVSEDDRVAIAQIMKAGLKAEIWGFARAMPDDVAAIADLGMRHAVIEAPISDLKLRALGVSREAVLQRIRTAVEFGAKAGIHVAFFGVDSTRADLAFFEQAYKTARDAGAKEFVVVDTIAISTPEAVRYLMGRAREWLGQDAVLHFHGHNDFGLGTACAIAAFQAGATWVHGTIDGIGERAGNANLPEIALALELLYGAETGFRFEHVRAASQRLREIAGYQLEPWKSVVGENLFVRETGAVAAQFHLPHAIEPYAAALLDTPRGIVLGKKSGAASITLKGEELGLKVADDKVPVLLAEVKKLALQKRGLLTDAEFVEIVKRHG
jgi:isopropylmalate/homocitrate/citramalate synthase